MAAAAFDQTGKSDLAQTILALSSSGKSHEEILSEIILQVQKATGIEAVGLRLADDLDYPYYFTNGFDSEFVQKEMYLCAKDNEGEILRDSKGCPILECMCGNIIYGRIDPSKPFFTEGGSFWANDTTRLLATTTDEDRQTPTRNRCNSEGYESVVLVPIKTEQRIYGLLQLNDRRKNMFSLEDIRYLEGVGATIGILFTAFKANQQLEAKTNDIVRMAAVRLHTLEKIATLMQENKDIESNPSVSAKLQAVLDEMKTIKGVLPICSTCKKIRVDSEYWQQIEGFIVDRTDAKLSHTFCPECYKKWCVEQGMEKLL